MLPVVRTSSTSTAHAPSRPATRAAEPEGAFARSGPVPACPGRTGRPWPASAREGRGPGARTSGRRPGRSGPPGRSRGRGHDPARPVRGRDRSPPAPAAAQRRPTACPSGSATPTVTGVLQPMERATGDPAERRAPLHLDQRRGNVPGQPDRRARRQVEPRVQCGEARRAQRRALALAARAGRGKGEVQGARGQPTDAAADVREHVHAGNPGERRSPLGHRRLTTRCAGRPPRPCRRRPPFRPAAPGSRRRPGRAARGRSTAGGRDGRTGRAGSRRDPARPTNTASIASRMKNMWIPFELGRKRPSPAGRCRRPIRPMNLRPQGRCHLDTVGEDRVAGQVPGAHDRPPRSPIAPWPRGFRRSG